MRSLNYRTNVQGPAVPLNPSSQQTDFDEKKRGDNAPLPQRGNQEAATGQSNQNLKENYQIGQDIASLRGDDQSTTQQRLNTSYTRGSKGQFSYQFQESGSFNKTLGDFVLSNKFQYGYDPNGGRQFASKDIAQK